MKLNTAWRRFSFRNVLLLLIPLTALSHPMGNFSVSHYSHLRVTAADVDLQYVLDLAEIPTFELLRDWKMDRATPTPLLETRARAQAR